MARSRRRFAVPRIDLKAHILLLAGVCVTGSIVLALSVRQPPAVEAAITGGFVAAVMSVYYAVMIFHGIRYDSGRARWRWEGLSWRDTVDAMAQHGLDVGRIGIPDIDFGDNLVAGLLALLGALLVGLLAIVLVAALA